MIELGKVQELVIIRTKNSEYIWLKRRGMRLLFFSQRSRCRREPGSGTR